jgi:hypothetical protein
MSISSRNPATGELLAEFDAISGAELNGKRPFARTPVV